MTLTFKLVTSKSIGVIYWWWPTCTPSINFHGQSILQLLSKNNVSAHCHCDLSAQGHCDLDFDLKINRVFYWAWPTCIPSMEFLGPSVLQLLSGNHFLPHKVTMTLTFDLLTSKSIGVIYWSWPTCIPSMKILCPSVLQLLSGNKCDGCDLDHCDLDLWPSDLKINRGHLLVVTNLHIKYEVPGPKQKLFISSLSLWPFKLMVTVTLTLDVLTSKSIGVFY